MCIMYYLSPQFQPKILFAVVEGTQANTGVLDPLSTSIKNGCEQYFTLIRDMTNSLQECLLKKVNNNFLFFKLRGVIICPRGRC